MKFTLTILTLLLSSFLFAQKEYFIKVNNNEAVNIDLKVDSDFSEHPLSDFISTFDVEEIYMPFKTKDENLQNTYVFEVSDTYSLEDLKLNLKQYNFIDYIEEVPEYKLFYTPNDPLFSQQYALSIINADLSWDISTCQGNSNVVVAITDDAVRTDHEDLVNAIWNNPNEIPNNGIDDDNNGFVDDVIGWDAADNDNDPSPPANATNSYFSHGTHVAGIAGASMDNNIGMASSSFGVQMMPVKIGTNSNGSLTGAYGGVDYTIACSYVDVVNMSWGGGAYSQTFQNLFNAGHNAGITFVAAAGNSNTSAPMYPASYNHVISVAASNQNDVRASFSNHGSTIDVVAPGKDILSTVAGATNAYDIKSGTSMASPLVAGLCGLMKCYDNGITPDEIEACLKSTADDIYNVNPSYQNQLGAGRINAQAALNCLSSVPIALFETADTLVCPNQTVQFNDYSGGSNLLTWSWQFQGGTPVASTLQNPTVSYAATGNYSVTLTVTNANGTDVLTKTNYVVVENPSAIISGNATITSGGVGFLKVDFSGTAPYSFIYTDGANNFTESNITQNPYYIAINPTQNITYNLISMEDAFCNGSVSGSAEIEVNQNNAESEVFCYFTNIYGDSQDNTINDVYYDSDNQVYYVCGQHGSLGLVIKLDENGNLIWEKSYSGVNAYYGVELLEDGTGVLLITEENNVSVSDIQITRITTDGLVVWSKKYDSGFSDRLIPRKSSKTLLYHGNSANEYYCLFGTAPSYPYDHTTMLTFNVNNGNVIMANKWSNNNGTGSNSENAPYNYIVDDDGNFAFVGPYTDLGDGGNFVKVDPVTNSLITAIKFEGSANDSRLFKVAQLDNGNYIISGIHRFGSSSYFPFILCIDKNTDNVLWVRRIQETLSTPENNFLTTTVVNNVYIVLKGDILVNLDSNGNLITSRIINGVSDARIEYQDGYLHLVDYSSYTQGFGSNDILIATLDTSLNNCLLSPYNLGITNENINNTPVSKVSSSVQMIATDFSNVSNDLNYLDTMLCNMNCDTVINSSQSCTDLFQKYFDDNGITRKVGIINTSDGGYLMGGSTTAFGQGSYDIFIAKYDDNDNLQWSNTYGTAVSGNNSGSELSYTTTMVEMDNGDFIVGCESNTYGTRPLSGNIVILRLSSNGNIIWQKKIDANIDYSHSRKMIKDGNDVVLVGSSGGSVTIGGLDDAYIMKIDGSGNIIFDNVLYGNNKDHLFDIKKYNNHYYALGVSHSINSLRNLYVTQFTLNGVVNWTKYLDLNDNISFSSLDFNSQNEMYILSSDNTQQDLYLSKYDDQMNLIGSVKKLNSQGTNVYNLISGIEVLNNNSLLISGTTSGNLSNASDLFISKFDENLNEIWTKIIGGNDDELSENGDVIMAVNDDESFVRLVGSTESYGNFSKNLFLSQLTLDTIVDCENIYQDYWSETSINSQTINHTFNTSNMPGMVNANFIQAVMPLQESVVCEVVCEDTTVTNPVMCTNSTLDTIVCLGDSLQLNAGAGSNYAWSQNYNISNTQIQNPIVWPEIDTTYIVYYQDDTCQYFDTINVEVQNVNVDANPDDTTVICTVDDLQLNANGANTYTWTPSTDLSNANIANPIFSGNNSETLIVTGQNQFGCSDTDTVFVEVLPCCGAYADFSASDTTICIGDSILFSNNSIAGNNANFTWNFGTNASPINFNGANPSYINFANPGTYEIELILTDDCGTDTAKMNIYVNDLPPVFIANDTSVCGLDTLHYELGDVEIAGNSYVWSPIIGLSNPNIANPIASVTDSMTYILTVVDFYTGCSNTDSVTIKVIPEPDNIIELEEASLCVGDFATVYSIVDYADSLKWQNQLSTDTLSFQILNDTLIFVDVYIDQCVFSDSLLLTADTLVATNLTYNDSICYGDWDTININTVGIPVWESGDTTFNLPIQILSDTIFVVAAYNGFCANYDTAFISVKELPNVNINGADTVCINSTETFNVITNGNSILWSNGATIDFVDYVLNSDTLITIEASNSLCSAIDSHYVYVEDSVEIEIYGELNYCENENYSLFVDTEYEVLWSTGSTNESINGLAQNDLEIHVEALNNYCPNAFDSVNLIIDTIPDIFIESPVEILENETYEVIVEGFADSWSWKPPYGLSCVNCQNPIIDIDSNMIYILSAENNGCFAFDTLKINLLNLENCLLIPTGFSPNNDGVNDVFRPIILDDKTVVKSLKIYNRWGELIHNSLDPWDGTYNGQKQNIDVYIYVLEYFCDDENKALTGNVTLIR